MQYHLTARNIEVGDWDREQMEKKLSRLEKHLITPFQINVHVTHNKHQSGEVVECTITVKQQSVDFHAKRDQATIQDALDDCIEAISQELAKAHDKRKDHREGLEEA